MPFSKLGLPEDLTNLLKEQKFEKAYPIQEKAIPVILQGKDLLGIAKTGSGKTMSYVLPVLAKLLSQKLEKNRHVDVLILVPTRELAQQVQEVFQQFTPHLYKHIKTKAVFGGVSINTQMMKMHGTHVLIATPGRLLDLCRSNAVHLSSVKQLVLDEADKMLSMGFEDEMNEIFKLLPEKRQNLLFSATLKKKLDRLNKLILNNPEHVEIDPDKDHFDTITQKAYLVSPERKGPLLRYLIKHNGLEQVLVFASSGYSADNVADKLRRNGIDAMSIHGKKSQGARTKALSEFKEGRLRVLVSTDLLGRGVDIEFLPYVVNYELPRSPKDYIHRIGRTGRAENAGEAISFVTDEDEPHFYVIQKKMKKRVPLTETNELDLHGY